MNFLYCLNPESEEPIMLVNKHIGFDKEEGFGIMGDQFERELLTLDTMNKKRIKVFINSPGGKVTDAMSMCNAILKSNTKVDTYNTGIAASCAANVFLTGRKRYMADYALLMIHDPYMPDEETPEEDKKVLSAFKQSIVTLLSSRSGKPETDISSMMSKETWMTPAQALEHGMCDEIEVSSEYNKKRLNQSAGVKATWKEAAAIMNKLNIIQNNVHMSYEKVANKLKLTADATPDSMLEAIESIENRATTAETSLVDARNQLSAKEKEMLEVSNKLTETTNKLKEVLEEKEKAEKEGKKVAATVMVTPFAKTGRIKDEQATIDKWVERAIVDFDGTKKELEDLPLNKQAPVINKVTSDGAIPYSAAARMAEIQNRTQANK